MNTLTDIRNEVVATLKAAGLKAVHYMPENYTPPVSIVQPSVPYVVKPVGNTYSEPYTVSIDVLVVSGKATHQGSAEGIDEMLSKVLVALKEDWDVTEVAAPGVTAQGYAAAVVTLQVNTNIKEVI